MLQVVLKDAEQGGIHDIEITGKNITSGVSICQIVYIIIFISLYRTAESSSNGKYPSLVQP